MFVLYPVPPTNDKGKVSEYPTPDSFYYRVRKNRKEVSFVVLSRKNVSSMIQGPRQVSRDGSSRVD